MPQNEEGQNQAQSANLKSPKICPICTKVIERGQDIKVVDKVEIHADCLYKQQETKRKRAFAKQLLWPYLVENTKSIQDAKVFIQALSVAINQEFNNRKRTMKVDSLKLIGKLDPKNEKHDQYHKMLKMFGDETIFDALDLIDGMGNAIDSFINEENHTRPLSSLKETLLD